MNLRGKTTVHERENYTDKPHVSRKLADFKSCIATILSVLKHNNQCCFIYIIIYGSHEIFS